MKEKKNNRRPLIIILLLVLSIFLVGLTATAIYAGRFVSREVNALLYENAPPSIQPLAPRRQTQEEGPSIYDQGVLVTKVQPTSPAQQAGIRRGTIILEVDGQNVDDLAQLLKALSTKGAGAVVNLKIINGPIPENVNVTLSQNPPLLGIQIAEAPHGERFGHIPPNFDRSEIPEDFRFAPDALPFDPGQFGFPEDFGSEERFRTTGVMVAEVVEGSAAAAAGIQPGDLIEKMDGRKIATVDDLITVLGSSSPGDILSTTVVRNGESEELSITLGKHPQDSQKGFLGIQPMPLMPDFGTKSGPENLDRHDHMLPEELFRHIHPDLESGEYFRLPDDFVWPESLEDFLPHGLPSDVDQDLKQQDA